MPLGAATINQALLDALAEQERQRLAKIEEDKRNARLQPTTPPPLGAPPSAVPMPYTPPLGVPREPRDAALAAPIPQPLGGTQLPLSIQTPPGRGAPPDPMAAPVAAPNVVQPLAPIAPGQDPGYQGMFGPKGGGLPMSDRFDTLNGPGRVKAPGEPELDPSNPAGSVNPPDFNAAQRYLGGQKIAGMVGNLNAMEGVGPDAPITEQQNAMVGGPLPPSLGDKAPANIQALQQQMNAGALAGARAVEVDHPTKWGRFKNALGAFGVGMLQGRGLLGSGYAAYEGAKASQHGSGDLGRFGDRMEDADALYEAEVKAKKAAAIDEPLKNARDVKEQMARIRLIEAQAGYQEAKPELDAKNIEARAKGQIDRAMRADNKEIWRQAEKIVQYYKGIGQDPPKEAWDVFIGGENVEIPNTTRYAIVAGHDAIYGVNPYNRDDAKKVGGVIPKPAADPGLGNRAELEVRRRLGDPEGPSKRNNPEYDAWLQAGGQNELLNTYAGENMQTFGMDPGTYRAYIKGEAPPELKEKVWAAWQALPPEQQDVYAGKLKAPKRVRKNSEDPEWNAQYNRELLEEEKKYRSAGPAQPTTAGAAPVADTRSEAQVQADGKAWAEANKAKHNGDVNAAYDAYMAEWRRQRAAANNK